MHAMHGMHGAPPMAGGQMPMAGGSPRKLTRQDSGWGDSGSKHGFASSTPQRGKYWWFAQHFTFLSFCFVNTVYCSTVNKQHNKATVTTLCLFLIIINYSLHLTSLFSKQKNLSTTDKPAIRQSKTDEVFYSIVRYPVILNSTEHCLRSWNLRS